MTKEEEEEDKEDKEEEDKDEEVTEIKEEEEEEDGILVKVMPLTESSIFSCLSMFYDSFLVEQRQQAFSVTDQVQTVQSV